MLSVFRSAYHHTRELFVSLLCIALFAFMMLVLLFIAARSAVSAEPLSATVSWTRATTYIDGTAIAAADHRETLVQWFRANSPGTIIGERRVTAPATSTVVTGLICGEYSFVAFTVLNNASQSTASNTAVKTTGVTCTPNPPIVTVQ